jgi:hypothetical protein
MALEITYQCGHTASVATKGQGTMRTEQACWPCALGRIQYKSDANLVDLWDDVEASVFFIHVDARGDIVIGTKNGVYELIKDEAEKQKLAPHQLIVLATLKFLSASELQTPV